MVSASLLDLPVEIQLSIYKQLRQRKRRKVCLSMTRVCHALNAAATTSLYSDAGIQLTKSNITVFVESIVGNRQLAALVTSLTLHCADWDRVTLNARTADAMIGKWWSIHHPQLEHWMQEFIAHRIRWGGVDIIHTVLLTFLPNLTSLAFGATADQPLWTFVISDLPRLTMVRMAADFPCHALHLMQSRCLADLELAPSSIFTRTAIKPPQWIRHMETSSIVNLCIHLGLSWTSPEIAKFLSRFPKIKRVRLDDHELLRLPGERLDYEGRLDYHDLRLYLRALEPAATSLETLRLFTNFPRTPRSDFFGHLQVFQRLDDLWLPFLTLTNAGELATDMFLRLPPKLKRLVVSSVPANQVVRILWLLKEYIKGRQMADCPTRELTTVVLKISGRRDMLRDQKLGFPGCGLFKFKTQRPEIPFLQMEGYTGARDYETYPDPWSLDEDVTVHPTFDVVECPWVEECAAIGLRLVVGTMT